MRNFLGLTVSARIFFLELFEFNADRMFYLRYCFPQRYCTRLRALPEDIRRSAHMSNDTFSGYENVVTPHDSRLIACFGRELTELIRLSELIELNATLENPNRCSLLLTVIPKPANYCPRFDPRRIKCYKSKTNPTKDHCLSRTA